MHKLIFCSLLLVSAVWSNQTDTVSPIYPEDELPFTIKIDQAYFSLPTGLQSYGFAEHDGKWLFIAGRTNGLHGFDNIGNNFPPSEQNTTVYVVDPATGQSWSRSLHDGSKLNQLEIDSLSVVAAQFLQKGKILYMVGGYGINTLTGEMETKSLLTAIDVHRLMNWVIKRKSSVKKAIRQVSHPLLQVTGGALFQANDHQPMLLIFGQNFIGLYRDGSNGLYTKQVRRFWINDNGKQLAILPAKDDAIYPDYRRRDLNIVPILQNNQEAYMAFSGVFTLDDGIWTVPVMIHPDGSSFEANPADPNTFKQGMNNYDCPAFGLYSTRRKEMFVVFPGGISFGYFSGGTFATDSEIPFINQVTTIKITKHNHFKQYLMNGEYPFIASTGTNPGNQLLFGAEAEFIPLDGVPLFSNGVIQLDALKSPTLIGHIVGGIMSTLPNTLTRLDSTASPYVFTVTLVPK